MGGRGAYKHGDWGNLENNASTATPSGLRFIRVYRRRSDSLSAGGADILLFLFNERIAMSKHTPSQSPMNKKETDLVVFPNLADNRIESFVDVDRLFRRCLHEDASEVFCQITALCIIDQFLKA